MFPFSKWLVFTCRWLAGFARRLTHHKGWTVLIAVATVGVAAIVMLLWWAVSLMVRWRFQFGIRSLLAFCLASSIAVSWFAVERQRAGKQREAVEALRSPRHGEVKYDWEFDADGMWIIKPEPPGPRWLREMLGPDFLSTVATMVVYGRGDAVLEHFKGLPELQSLELWHTEMTDAGLVNLKGFTKLQFLNLAETKVTDAGLENLKGLTQLQQLWLERTGVTDAGVKKLQQALPNCEIHH